VHGAGVDGEVQQPDEEGSEADDPVDNCEEHLLDGAEQPPELCYGISPVEYSGVKNVFRRISYVFVHTFVITYLQLYKTGLKWCLANRTVLCR
jgi:hypothetical protein